MNVNMQNTLNPSELLLVLQLVRAGSLAQTAERQGVNTSTVFRCLQRIERGLGRTLFVRSRHGLLPNELALSLVAPAEALEAALETAHQALTARSGALEGRVCLSTTDSVLHALVAPALQSLAAKHPRLQFDLHTGNELANLTRRDADLALRATTRPPPHLVGRRLGSIRVAVYAAAKSGKHPWTPALAAASDWIAPDDTLPEHPSVRWRKRHFPKVQPRWQVGSIVSAAALCAQGLGLAVLPLFLAEGQPSLRRLSEVLDEAQTELWLLSHPEARHVRRIDAVCKHLAETLHLP